MSTVTELNKKNKWGVSIPKELKLDEINSQINAPHMIQTIEAGFFLYSESMVVVPLLRAREGSASENAAKTDNQLHKFGEVGL